MRVNEELQTENPEVAVEPEAPRVAMPVWLRLAYAFEFLLSLIAALMLWTQVGGQGHMDLLPWYVKLVCVVAIAWATVRFTAAMVQSERAWNRRSQAWLAGVIFLAVVMGAITFYYHLHEVTEEQETDDTSNTSVSVDAAGRCLNLL
jgi:hypothetical protein